MTKWKLDIFVSAIKTRFENGEGTYEEIISRYTKLTDEEKEEILAVLNS